MYKKITHSIVEEHFDHPLAAKIKSGLRNSTAKRAKMYVEEGDEGEDIIFGRPTNEIFNKAEFTQNFESYISNYTQKLIQITDTTAGTEEQLVDAFDELFNMVNNISDFLNPFYNRELGERTATSFRHIASSVTMISHTVKAGWDPTPWIQSLNSAAGIAEFSNYNTSWSRLVIENIMKKFMIDIVNRIKAVKAQDQTTIDKTTQDVMTSMQEFKNLILNGITRQFPQRFTA
jgi:hypothetical protein